MVHRLHRRHVIVADVIYWASAYRFRYSFHESFQGEIIQISKIIYKKVLRVVVVQSKVHVLEHYTHVWSITDSRVRQVY